MAESFNLRSDLEFSEQLQGGERCLVVKDPVTNRFFRFSAKQAAIVDTLRSAEPIPTDAITRLVGERLGGELLASALEAFLRSLEERWLLDTDFVRRELEGIRKTRFKKPSSILYLRIAEFDAKGLLDWLAPRLRWCFTPFFHLVALLLIAAGLILAIANAGPIAADALSLVTPGGALLAALVVLAVTTIHELAHGLACRHYGGNPSRIGVMLIYFAPALYCNISDTWMFPVKRHRLWVTFAGGYVQLAVWGVATVVWRITDTNTVVNQAALGAVLFGGIQTLFNFNPLIRLDGYYMLSDYLEIPNLREKAFRAFRAWVAGSKEPLLATAERGALLRFAVLATLFSTLLLTVVYVKIVELAVGAYAFFGLVASGLFIGFTLKRAAAEPIAASRALLMRANQKKIRNYGVLALVVAIVLLFPWELRIPADFVVLPSEEGVVRAETEGLIDEVLVTEGTTIEAGDTIARMSDFDKQTEMEQIRGDIAQARAELRLLLLGPRAEEIERAAREVNTSETRLGNVRRNEQDRTRLEEELAAQRAELDLAVTELEITRIMHEEGLEPAIAVGRDEAAVEVLAHQVSAIEADLRALDESTDRDESLRRSELAEAESNYTLVASMPREEEIERIHAQLAALERRKILLDQQLALSEIRAPISGTIVTQNMEQLRNRAVSRGDELARIVDYTMVKARLSVPEKDLADVVPASRIVLKSRAHPLRDFEGQVDFIAPVADVVGNSRFVDVEALLMNHDGALRPGTTGVAKIYAGRRLVIQLISRKLVQWIRTEFWDLIP